MLEELNGNAGSSTKWAKISTGKIVIQSDSSDEKSKSRINKANNQVWERFYASIAGKITTLSVEENPFGEVDVRVGLENGDDRAVLTFALYSSYGRDFVNQIFNTDLTQMIKFTPWMKVFEDGAKRTKLYLNYSTGKVEYKSLEGTPEVKWVETKKGNVIDPVSKADHDDFVFNALQKFIKDNELEYKNNLSDMKIEDLLPEEKAQLVSPTKAMNKTKTTFEPSQEVNASDDDFFGDL